MKSQVTAETSIAIWFGQVARRLRAAAEIRKGAKRQARPQKLPPFRSEQGRGGSRSRLLTSEPIAMQEPEWPPHRRLMKYL